jgi:hypothetical protein
MNIKLIIQFIYQYTIVKLKKFLPQTECYYKSNYGWLWITPLLLIGSFIPWWFNFSGKFYLGINGHKCIIDTDLHTLFDKVILLINNNIPNPDMKEVYFYDHQDNIIDIRRKLCQSYYYSITNFHECEKNIYVIMGIEGYYIKDIKDDDDKALDIVHLLDLFH